MGLPGATDEQRPKRAGQRQSRTGNVRESWRSFTGNYLLGYTERPADWDKMTPRLQAT